MSLSKPSKKGATGDESSQLLEYIKFQEQVRREEREERERQREEKERQRMERECQRKEEIEERERRWQFEQDERDRRWREEREMMQNQFAQLVNRVEAKDKEVLQVRRELEEERKEEKRKAAIPKLTPMSIEADVLEYLETFEENMEKRGIKKDEWSTHLVPLLNDDSRAAALCLEAEEREKYNVLKEELLSTCSSSVRRAGETFWTLERKKGQTFSQYARVLARLAHRFAAKETVKETLDQVVIEKLLQTLPRQAATNIREKEPKTSKEAARLAQFYFQDRHSDPDDQRWMKKSDWCDTRREGFGRQHRDFRYGKDDRREDKYHQGGKSKEATRRASSEDVSRREVTKKNEERRDEKKQMGGQQKRRGPQCYECQGWGHMRDKCPSRVLFVQSPKKKSCRREPWTMEGRINGKEVKYMMLDSGADYTVVAREAVSSDCLTGRQAEVRGILPKVSQFDLANVNLEVGEWKLDLEVLIAPRGTLKYSALLGRDIPGLEVTMKPPPQEVLPVLTRAAAKRQKQQQDEDDKATEESEVNPLQLEELPDLLSEGEGDREEPVGKEDAQDEDKDENAEGEVEEEEEEEAKAEDDHKMQENLVAKDTEDQLPMEADAEDGWQATYLDGIDIDHIAEKKTEEAWMNVTRPDLIVLQQEDPTIQPLMAEARQEDSPYYLDKGLLMRHAQPCPGKEQGLILIPKQLRSHIFDMAHSHSTGGHLGKKKTLQKITRHFYWPGLRRDIQQRCKQCVKCQKGNRKKQPRAPLKPLPVIEKPWHRIAIDIVGPLQRTTKGYKYLLTVMDFATRFPEAIPLRRIDALTVCEELITLFSRYGLPEELLSDRGSNFMAKLTEELLKKLHIKHLKSSPYHPQSNGMLERFHSVLKQMLRKTCPQAKDWDKWLPFVLFAYRETPHSSTGFSPFELMFGRDVRGPLTVVKEQWTMEKKLPQSVVEFVFETQRRLQETSKLVKDADQRSKQASKTWYDKRARDDPINVGEEVLVLLPEDSTGMTAQWHGPFHVLEKPTPLTYIISTPQRGRKTRTFHRNLLKRYVQPYEVMQIMVADEEDDMDDQLNLVHPTIESNEFEEQSISMDHLTKEQQETLKTIQEEFKDVFSMSPGITHSAMHTIDTGNAHPISQPPYRVPAKWKEQLSSEVEQLLKSGLISPSSSPWAAPVVCVRKKDGSLRMCIDYRKLNSVTANDTYPIPRIDDLTDSVGNSTFITTLDLRKGYYQIPVAEPDCCKTAFITPQGKFQFNRMPFGLKGAPATFQRMMDNLLRENQDFSTAYIDDTIIYSDTWEEHVQHIRAVLRTFREAGLTVKSDKCAFARKHTSFLGHVVGSGQVRPQQAKIEAIKNFKKPQKKGDIRSFLGLVGYYRKFIPNFSTIAAPLTDLTGKKAPEKPVWTTDQEQAFEALKQALTTDSVLKSPEPDKEYILQTDASQRGVGAVLSQKDKQGILRPVAFYSRKLLARETKYTVTELECLAIVNATKHFSVYLLGNRFIIETDHAALKYLTSMRNGGPRLTRWALSLQPFDFKIKYRRGMDNGNADGLSRQAWSATNQDSGSDLHKEGGVLGTSLLPTSSGP